MQRLEVSGAVRHLYVIRRLKNENEAIEITQRKCHSTFNQVSHPAARTA
jgi:hypothetical protein